MEITVERMEPEHTRTSHWLPCAIDPQRDDSTETRPLVEFTLEEDGGGWTGQLKNFEKHVTR